MVRSITSTQCRVAASGRATAHEARRPATGFAMTLRNES